MDNESESALLGFVKKKQKNPYSKEVKTQGGENPRRCGWYWFLVVTNTRRQITDGV